jgi:hypothetical protein
MESSVKEEEVRAGSGMEGVAHVVPSGINVIPITASWKGVCVTGHAAQLCNRVLILDVWAKDLYRVPFDPLTLEEYL